MVRKNVAFLMVNIQRRLHFYALTLWKIDNFKLVSSLVGLLYSLVTNFTRKKSLGHPLALQKANQIWIRFRPRKKNRKTPLFMWPYIWSLILAFTCNTTLGFFLGHPVAPLKANQIWFRFLPRGMQQLWWESLQKYTWYSGLQKQPPKYCSGSSFELY